jgi:hypothetical protein
VSEQVQIPSNTAKRAKTHSQVFQLSVVELEEGPALVLVRVSHSRAPTQEKDRMTKGFQKIFVDSEVLFESGADLSCSGRQN